MKKNKVCSEKLNIYSFGSRLILSRIALSGLCCLFLLSFCSCAITTTAASVQRDKVLEDAKTARAEEYYEKQDRFFQAMATMATTPLISITTPDAQLPDGTVIKGTTVTVNREIKIPNFQQYQNQPTFGERLSLAVTREIGGTVRTLVPFAGAAYGLYQQRKSQEDMYNYQAIRDQTQAELITGMKYDAPSGAVDNSVTTTNTTETTTTDSRAYGDASGNDVGNDQHFRQGSNEDYSSNPVDSSTNDESTNDSYNDQSSVTESPVVPVTPVVQVVPVIPNTPIVIDGVVQ